jgi:hypothetical protein
MGGHKKPVAHCIKIGRTSKFYIGLARKQPMLDQLRKTQCDKYWLKLCIAIIRPLLVCTSTGITK